MFISRIFFKIGVGSHNAYFRIVLGKIIVKILKPSESLIVGVIRGSQDNVESCFCNGIRCLSGGVERGITAESPVVATYRRLLIDYGDISCIYKIKDVLEKKVIISGSVRLCSLIDQSHMKKIITDHHHMYIEFIEWFLFGLGFRFRYDKGFSCHRVRFGFCLPGYFRRIIRHLSFVSKDRTDEEYIAQYQDKCQYGKESTDEQSSFPAFSL